MMRDAWSPTEEEICKVTGLSLDCLLPLEISASDGCSASGRLAQYILDDLAEYWHSVDHQEDEMKDIV